MTWWIQIRIASTTLSMSGSTLVVAINARMKRTKLADVSASIRQDVLLLAGFTRSESAQNHCQVGNHALAPGTIVNWLDEMPGPN